MSLGADSSKRVLFRSFSFPIANRQTRVHSRTSGGDGRPSNVAAANDCELHNAHAAQSSLVNVSPFAKRSGGQSFEHKVNHSWFRFSSSRRLAAAPLMLAPRDRCCRRRRSAAILRPPPPAAEEGANLSARSGLWRGGGARRNFPDHRHDSFSAPARAKVIRAPSNCIRRTVRPN